MDEDDGGGLPSTLSASVDAHDLQDGMAAQVLSQ